MPPTTTGSRVTVGDIAGKIAKAAVETVMDNPVVKAGSAMLAPKKATPTPKAPSPTPTPTPEDPGARLGGAYVRASRVGEKGKAISDYEEPKK
jgi:hypothetical protein